MPSQTVLLNAEKIFSAVRWSGMLDVDKISSRSPFRIQPVRQGAGTGLSGTASFLQNGLDPFEMMQHMIALHLDHKADRDSLNFPLWGS